MAVELIGAVAGAGSFVLDVVKCLAAPIERPFKYLYNYNTNFKNLEKEVTKLKNTRDEVQVKVTAAERNVEEIKQNVKDWQTDVEKTITEAEQLIQAKENNPRCFKGLCPNLITRYKRSRKAVGLKRDDIGPLLQQEKEFTEVAHPTNPPEIWLRSNEDYLAFESRNSTVKDVWDALNDENISMIGVYGMGGLGKTTLVQEISRQAMNDQLFDEIAFTEVTETLDIKKIQTEVADKLGLKFNNESEKARKLYERLRNGKKILLILDNIWEDLDLKTIGIPPGVDCGGCKLLLITRNLDVLEKMGSINNFGMNVLNQEEAWSLFQKMAGNVIQAHELESLPIDVCKECGGLPVVICAIAKALRNKSRLFDWKVALRELRAPSPTKFVGFLEKEYQKLALSYKFLRDDELKKTFLISSLMENGTSISELFKHVVGLDILEGANLTIEEARDRLDKLVCELKDSCLLLDGFNGEQFAMHDVIRAVAVTIAYTDHYVFTWKNDIEREWMNKDKLKKCTKIFLRDSSIISQLWPKDLDCPDLEFLYMNNLMFYSFEIPEDFFKVMPKLKVLNLLRMHRGSLPSSLDLLTNLQTLCLDYSIIGDVAIIGKLRKLKVLSLQCSTLKELTTEIGHLTQLRLLDLSNCMLEVIVPNVISKLSQLEELYLKGCPIQWKVEVLEELKGLSQLTSLELDIKDYKMLPKDFFSRKLKRYKISTGHWSYKEESFFRYPSRNMIKKHEFKRVLKLFFNSTISSEDLQRIKNVEFLWLAELSEVENGLIESQMRPLFEEQVIFPDLKVLILTDINSSKIWDSQLPTSSYQNLIHFILEFCGNIKYVFPSTIAKSLQQLQLLEICFCKDLEEIVVKEEGIEATINFVFPEVTLLKLRNLPKLTTFYPGIHTSEWPKLKELVVEECDKFEMFTSEPKSICLNQKINHDLEVFELKNGQKQITWRSRSQALNIKYDNSTNIPLGLLQTFENPKELRLLFCDLYKEIKCRSDLVHLEVLDVQQCRKLITLVPSSASFQNLKVLNVSCCNGLINLLTPSTAKSLVQLREMSIQHCDMVIEIVENEGDATTSAGIVFDNLKKLLLKKLESLTCFCSGNYSFNFSFLEEFIIGECPNMKTFSQGILSTPKLHKVNYEILNEIEGKWENIMEVENEGNDLNKIIQGAYKKQKQDISIALKCKLFQDDNSIEICYNQHPTSFYQNLTHLFLWNCGNIKYAFPSSIAKSLHQLQQLKIGDCKVLEEIVAKEERANAVVNFVFPNVTFLKLKNLPKLSAFYHEIHTSEWPMLKELVVIACGKFTSKHMSFQENSEEGELHISEPKSLFLNDEVNHDLEVFEFKNGMKEIIWQRQFKALEIKHDQSTNIGLLQRFENLKVLQLSFCHQVEEIKSLSNLLNLKVLYVGRCNSLMSLMSSSFRSLVQLREMCIYDCGMLIEIVKNEGDATSTEIVFDNLKTLSLINLESLTCFCSGNYSFNFPSLEKLKIKECPNIETFSQGILITPKLTKFKYEREEKDLESEGIELNATIQQAHTKKVDSGLEELTLSGRDIMPIRQGEFQESFDKVDSDLEELTLSGRDIMPIRQGEFQESFGKVKTLQLVNDEYANIPLQILHKFNHLEKLILKESSYEDIFSFEEDEEQVGALTKLEVLELHELFNLKCFWKQDSRLNSILQNLDCLEVQYCHNLMTLLPSSTSFENLTFLEVNYCNGMQNLMSSSTVKSLARLEVLSIKGCEKMTEVLTNEGDIEKSEIVFERLEGLELNNLESLTCFSSGNYTLKFPNLECLYVDNCFKMKTFFGGGLSMPRLQELNSKPCLESDIDTIIQQSGATQS